MACGADCSRGQRQACGGLVGMLATASPAKTPGQKQCNWYLMMSMLMLLRKNFANLFPNVKSRAGCAYQFRYNIILVSLVCRPTLIRD